MLAKVKEARIIHAITKPEKRPLRKIIAVISLYLECSINLHRAEQSATLEINKTNIIISMIIYN